MGRAPLLAPLKISVGSCVYRMQVDARHAACVAKLGLELEHERAAWVAAAYARGARSVNVSRDPIFEGEEPAAIVSIGYHHTSLLPAGRAKILADAMEGVGDWHLSFDSDTWVRPEHVIRILRILRTLPSKTASVGILVPQDDGMVNAWEARGQRLRAPQPWKPITVHAIGAAAMLYNLNWHRKVASENVRWPWVAFAVQPTGMPHVFIGEDYWYCEAVRDQGGQILAVYTEGGVYHNAFAAGESEV